MREQKIINYWQNTNIFFKNTVIVIKMELNASNNCICSFLEQIERMYHF